MRSSRPVISPIWCSDSAPFVNRDETGNIDVGEFACQWNRISVVIVVISLVGDEVVAALWV